jgi:hypothetical protein
MRESVSWDVLESEFSSFDDHSMQELCQLIHSPEFDANNELFRAGKQFVKDYPSNQESISVSNGVRELSTAREDMIEQQLLLNATFEEEEMIKESQKNVLKELEMEQKEKSNLRRKADTINFMRGIMDECTHLANFCRPVDPELAFIVTASRDGYVPQAGSIPLTDLWKGCTHRNIPDHGHVSAILFKGDVFRTAIRDSFDINCRKYYNTSLSQDDDQDRDDFTFSKRQES